MDFMIQSYIFYWPENNWKHSCCVYKVSMTFVHASINNYSESIAQTKKQRLSDSMKIILYAFTGSWRTFKIYAKFKLPSEKTEHSVKIISGEKWSCKISN